ncbi:MAG: metal-dependent transcriptional regulator [Ruminococcus sp.]|nr:metal-dependent transcriptional regulator [Ruminococcus sp.]MCM1381343.1 metal-dependent transcriptional regulator [Muribaculaceae bacterium]MCM1480543.1 metal-dependent transcriptional regulator [Muribaculaceae bacterium]
MSIYESGEDYLETILLLHKKTGYVRSVDIASELGYSKPSISRAMGILKNDGYITVEHGGQIMLTDNGKAKAEEVYGRHVMLREFLSRILGVSDENSERDACRIEHILSEETCQKLREFMEKNK